MQAHFEARFNTYLALTSDRTNSCNFLTLLFKRVVHFFREKEWVTDVVILEKFKASIQKPTEKTKEIYQLFADRIGPCRLLDEIKEKLFSTDLAQLSIKQDEKRPIMKMSHSRFTPQLWDYACGRNLRSRLFPSVTLLTKDGNNLSDQEKATLKELTDDCINHNTPESREKLFTWMLEIEKEERLSFITFLRSYLDRILNGDPPEKLKLDLRIIRKYLIYRSLSLSKEGSGESKQIYLPLLKLILPEINQNYRCHKIDRIIIKNDRIYIPLNEHEPASSHFAAGFVIGHDRHATAYIYDGKDYQWLDNGRKAKTISAKDLYEHLLKIKLDTSWDYFLVDELNVPNAYPDPSRWSYPNWERDNCFVASSLVLLACSLFYERQKN